MSRLLIDYLSLENCSFSYECFIWIAFQFGNNSFRLFQWKLLGQEWDFNFPSKIRRIFHTSKKEKTEAQLVVLGWRVYKPPDGVQDRSPWKLEPSSFLFLLNTLFILGKTYIVIVKSFNLIKTVVDKQITKRQLNWVSPYRIL